MMRLMLNCLCMCLLGGGWASLQAADISPQDMVDRIFIDRDLGFLSPSLTKLNYQTYLNPLLLWDDRLSPSVGVLSRATHWRVNLLIRCK